MSERTDLDHVRALLAGATDGPWEVTQDGNGIGASVGPGPNGRGVMWRVVVEGEVDADDCDDIPLPPTCPVGVLKAGDAALIAAAPSLLAAMADELAAARAALAGAVQAQVLTEDTEEPGVCSSIVAADGTCTYRRSLTGEWQQIGQTAPYTWEGICFRIGERPVYVLSGVAGGVDYPCSSEGCTQRAVEVLRFRDQPGHVHDCAEHAAAVREFCDVIWSGPMPCTQPHDGSEWDAMPAELT